jgi:ParB family chromosome partitioning protein
MGTERGGFWDADKLAALVEHSPAKTQHVTLAVVLGGIEDSTSKNTWRHPETTKALYFKQLAAWGYALSEVEQIVADATSAVTASTLADADDHHDEFDDDNQIDG